MTRKQSFAVAAAGVMVALAGAAQAGPVQRFENQTQLLPPLSNRTYSLQFKSGERATAEALGNGATYLGLYVYDAHGNCIAWDDQAPAQTRDDLGVDWYPLETGMYTVEVRNSGPRANNTKIIIR
jgi:hypothetical protein